MRRQIDFNNNHFEATAFKKLGKKLLQIGNGEPQEVDLTIDGSGDGIIRFGEQNTSVKIAVKGETVFIHAFERTFSLRIVDPVEQAVRKAGGRSGIYRAPMPGTVVDVNVAESDRVTKGQPMMTIESMKILTIIKAPRDGVVAQVHIESGQTFEKNTVLVTLAQEEEK